MVSNVIYIQHNQLLTYYLVIPNITVAIILISYGIDLDLIVSTTTTTTTTTATTTTTTTATTLAAGTVSSLPIYGISVRISHLFALIDFSSINDIFH